MQDWLKQAQAKAVYGTAAQPILGAGGVNYLTSTAGSQSFNVAQLVSR